MENLKKISLFVVAIMLAGQVVASEKQKLEIIKPTESNELNTLNKHRERWLLGIYNYVPSDTKQDTYEKTSNKLGKLNQKIKDCKNNLCIETQKQQHLESQIYHQCKTLMALQETYNDNEKSSTENNKHISALQESIRSSQSLINTLQKKIQIKKYTIGVLAGCGLIGLLTSCCCKKNSKILGISGLACCLGAVVGYTKYLRPEIKSREQQNNTLKETTEKLTFSSNLLENQNKEKQQNEQSQKETLETLNNHSVNKSSAHEYIQKYEEKIQEKIKTCEQKLKNLAPSSETESNNSDWSRICENFRNEEQKIVNIQLKRYFENVFFDGDTNTIKTQKELFHKTMKDTGKTGLTPFAIKNAALPFFVFHSPNPDLLPPKTPNDTIRKIYNEFHQDHRLWNYSLSLEWWKNSSSKDLAKAWEKQQEKFNKESEIWNNTKQINDLRKEINTLKQLLTTPDKTDVTILKDDALTIQKKINDLNQTINGLRKTKNKTLEENGFLPGDSENYCSQDFFKNAKETAIYNDVIAEFELRKLCLKHELTTTLGCDKDDVNNAEKKLEQERFKFLHDPNAIQISNKAYWEQQKFLDRYHKVKHDASQRKEFLKTMLIGFIRHMSFAYHYWGYESIFEKFEQEVRNDKYEITDIE